MKKLLLAAIISAFSCSCIYAQTATVLGPAEKKITDSLCDCISKLDQSKIKTSKEANAAFMDCFTKQAALLVDFAEERKASMDDDDAMNKLGIDIGKNLLKQKCEGFAQLGLKMAKDNQDEISSTEGKFKRIENKGFNYIVLADLNNQEKSFLWLKQFDGSENFTGDTAKYVGKKLKIEWQEMEVYLPSAKGYYKVKEITSVTVL